MINKLVLTLCSSVPLFLSLTNALLYEFKTKQKAIFFLYIFISIIIFPQVFPKYFIFATLIGSWCLIVLFRGHIFINIISSLLGYMFSVCINYFLLILLDIVGLTYNEIKNSILYMSLFCIVFSFFIYAATFFLRKGIFYLLVRKLKSGYFKSIPTKIWGLLFAELIACLTIFLFNLTYGNATGYPQEAVYFNGIILISLLAVTITIIILMLRTLIKENSLSSRLREYETLQEYTQKVENLYSEMRTFKHDYINILSSMEIFLKEEKYEELNEYFMKEILPTGQALTFSDSILGHLSKVQVLELKGLLYGKLIFAMNHSLNISVDIPCEISFLPIDAVEFVRIIGIFMDNAIEAAVETEEKTLYLGMIQVEEEMIIKISNSCENEIETDNLYQMGTSSKSDSRGMGLYNARKILNPHHNVLLTTTCKDGVFTQELHAFKEV